MTAEGWKTIGEGITAVVVIAQLYFAQRQRDATTVKLDEVHKIASTTADAVNGHLTSVTNELATTSRALADVTGSAKDIERAGQTERAAADHAAENPVIGTDSR